MFMMMIKIPDKLLKATMDMYTQKNFNNILFQNNQNSEDSVNLG